MLSFFADLRAGRIEIGHAHAQIVRRHLEGAAGARAGLFKDQRNVLAAVHIVRDALLLARLQIGGQIDQILNFLRREIQQLQIAPALEIHDGPSRLIALNGIIIRLIEYICKDAARIFLVDLCKEKEYNGEQRGRVSL